MTCVSWSESVTATVCQRHGGCRMIMARAGEARGQNVKV